MNIEELGKKIRLMLTGLLIAEYALIQIKDGTKQDLKLRVTNAISVCRRVQEWFIFHNQSSPETAAIFKQQFMGNEIVLLTELVETCFGINEDGLEEIINAIKQNLQPVEDGTNVNSNGG